MGGASSRSKGQRGEREVATLLNEALGTAVQRNLEQYQNGGNDLVDKSNRLNAIDIEIKRQEKLSLPAWWRQTLAQCRADRHPVLIYRTSRKPWLVQMKLSSICADLPTVETITLSLAGFIAWAETQVDDG